MSSVARRPVVAAPTDRWTRIQQAAGTLAALSTLAVLVFTWLSIQQVEKEHGLTREGQVTDRYNAAVGNIGDDSLEVRLGGIYALQRIMEDSPRDQPSIVNVLSLYVRNHAKKPTQGTDRPMEPPSDVQAALTALGSRNPEHDDTTRVDLRGAYLRGADLNGANLINANLRGADLRNADLTDANLISADLEDADLRVSYLTEADLTEADLKSADLRVVDMTDANLEGADMVGADLRGADLTDANLNSANLDGADLTDANLDGIKR